MIIGHGSSNPAAIFIADAAVGEDLKTGRALSGYTESTLMGFCKGIGMDYRAKFYKTCLVKGEFKIPQGKRTADEVRSHIISTDLVVKEHLPLLIEEINELQPNLLIPLGDLSFTTLTGLHNIRKFRGSVMLAEGSLGINKPIKVLPILGPYPYLNQEYRLRHITKVDFGKIPNHIDGSTKLIEPNVWIARTPSALRAFLDRHYDPKGLLVFDIETYHGIPTCISFCFDGLESVCVPFTDQSLDIDIRIILVEIVAKLLISPIRKVNQNIKYDWKRLEAWRFCVNNVVGDTMLAASCLYCEFPKNLGFLTSIYTDLPYFKDEGREFNPDKHKKDQFYLYNAKDSLATYQIYSKQSLEIKEQGVQYVYNRLVELMPIYRRMEDRGIRIDPAERERLTFKYQSLYELEVMKLTSLAERPTNPLSPKQCFELIFTELGFDKIRGVKGTDEESLEQLMVYGTAKRSPIFGKQILQVIINCRKLHKVLELLELPLYPDGRFRCEFNLSGTVTGRTSAGKSTDRIILLDSKGRAYAESLGHSLQTIGKHGFMIDGVTYGRDIRNMFIPSPGYIFVECDLSQAEARVDAVLAGRTDIPELFDTGPGIHKLTGSWIYGCDPTEIKKSILIGGVDRYHMAKTVRHAGERNMREDRLVMMTQCSLKEATKTLKTFHDFQPEIRHVFHKDVRDAINAKGHCLIAPNGRRRDFFDRIDNHTYNEAISQLPQAIVSDQTKFSLIPTSREAPWAYYLSEQHDGVLAEVPIGREEEYYSIYRKNIETKIDFRGCTLSREYNLVIPCEGSKGFSWGSLEEMK